MLNATLIRFVINGIVATAAHYATLVALMEYGGLGSAGLANGLAAIVGITVSYLGNYKHVFRSNAAHSATLPRFLGVYAAVAAVHGAVLAIWTDRFGLPYQFGFIIATALAVMLTFTANSWFVFRQDPKEPRAALSRPRSDAIRGTDGRD